MQVVDWERLMAGKAQEPPVALTVGVFDSLHLGHQGLIRAVVENDWGALAAVCTFRQNPALVLGSRTVPGSILSFRQKMERLEALGIAVVVLIDFSTEISKLTGKRFLDLLTGRLTIRRMVVGYNFHMGQGRDTGVNELRAMLSGSDTELQVVPAAHHGGEIVSSSRIRACIREARFEEARAMMGKAYALDLRDAEVSRRAGAWRVSGVQIPQVLPRAGAYRVALLGSRAEREDVVWVGESDVQGEGELAPCYGEIRFERPLELPEQGPTAGTPSV
jgi:riboflavin kinase/FMN adenylyltransferase